MRDEAVDDNPNALGLVLDRYKTQEMCDKAVDDYFITLEFVPDRDISLRKCVIKLFPKILSC